jgi:predicted amidophosphoribosyltransferase
MFLAGELTSAIELSDWRSDVDALVHVPTHWTHAIRRPLYVPRILTRIVSRMTGLPIAQVIRRIEGGKHQMDVPRKHRALNIRGKFATIPGASFRGGRFCMIDDISTTGATLNECAKVLKQAGAGQVFAAVVGKVDMHG